MSTEPARDPRPDEGDPGVLDVSRRAFLALAGFGVAGALAGCGRAPVELVSTWSRQPEGHPPGKATWYAATCQACEAGCGLLVKTRDGRPIKVEGNPEHPLSRGGVCALGQASVLSLYDTERLSRPLRAGLPVTWAEADRQIRSGLEQARREGGAVRLLTGTLTSPSTREAVRAFLATFDDARHVEVDALSASALLDAHEITHGARRLPRFDLQEADVLLGVDADFLGTWISPVEHTRAWSARRTPPSGKRPMLRHVQVESALTLTGSNADRRIPLRPDQIPLFVAHLAARIGRATGKDLGVVPEEGCPVADTLLEALASELVQAAPRALLLCGANDLDTQLRVAAIHHALGAYGVTVDLDRPSQQRQGHDRAFESLRQELDAGAVQVLVVAGADPVASLPGGRALAERLSRVGLGISWAERENETTRALAWTLPAPHALEAWDDAEPVAGTVTLSQPTLRPFGEPRSLREVLAAWRGEEARDPELLKRAWERSVYPRADRAPGFRRFWEQSVHDGFARVDSAGASAAPYAPTAGPEAPPPARVPRAGHLQLVLMPSHGLLDGRHAENPWLQELPDPLTKQCWGNAALLSPGTAEALGVVTGNVIEVRAVEADASALVLPVLVQAGQADGVLAVALGHGRRGTARFARTGPRWLEGRPTVEEGGVVGVDASPLLDTAQGRFRYAGREVRVAKTDRHEDLALSQTYQSLDLPARTAPSRGKRRDAVRETTVKALAPQAEGAGHDVAHARGHGADALWRDDHPYEGRRWGMVIDLNACTGCSACVVACQAENNIPVVGKDEVRRRRDMQWLRIDRYASERPDAPGEVDVSHQPMLCHHCANAPCETVCPVLATVHTEEGLNAQAYNRCVGTRYCANNCPYKVRRFNWFEYDRGDDRMRLVLNPDVTVRSRGVMDKCSFCVQRIQEAKAEARRLGVPLADGAVQTACQQSCPAGAIVFGDLNDPESRVRKGSEDARHYRVLEELNVRPAVGYLKKVRNRSDAQGGAHHG